MTQGRVHLPCLLLIGVVATGCGADTNTVTQPAETLPAQRAPAWRDQVDAVRAGISKRISIEGTAAAFELAELAEGCDALEVLELEHADLSAGALLVIGRLPALKRIKIDSPVDDDGIAQLAAAKTLEAVNLPQGTFSDRGLHALANLPALQLLRFRSANVTDAGLAEVATMPALRFLHLIDVPITDAGLEHLHGMHRLESFYLDGGNCTDDGLRGLLTALPDLHFHLDQLHLPGDPQADHDDAKLPNPP